MLLHFSPYYCYSLWVLLGPKILLVSHVFLLVSLLNQFSTTCCFCLGFRTFRCCFGTMNIPCLSCVSLPSLPCCSPPVLFVPPCYCSFLGASGHRNLLASHALTSLSMALCSSFWWLWERLSPCLSPLFSPTCALTSLSLPLSPSPSLSLSLSLLLFFSLGACLDPWFFSSPNPVPHLSSLFSPSCSLNPSRLLFFSQAALARMDFLASYISLFLSSFVQVSLLVSKLLCLSRCALGRNRLSVKLPYPPSLPHVTLLDDFNFRVLQRG